MRKGVNMVVMSRQGRSILRECLRCLVRPAQDAGQENATRCISTHVKKQKNGVDARRARGTKQAHRGTEAGGAVPSDRNSKTCQMATASVSKPVREQHGAN